MTDKNFVKLVVEGQMIDHHEGDLTLIEPGERYFWEGNMTMFMPCSPAWYTEKHKEIEK